MKTCENTKRTWIDNHQTVQLWAQMHKKETGPKQQKDNANETRPCKGPPCNDRAHFKHLLWIWVCSKRGDTSKLHLECGSNDKPHFYQTNSYVRVKSYSHFGLTPSANHQDTAPPQDQRCNSCHASAGFQVKWFPELGYLTKHPHDSQSCESCIILFCFNPNFGSCLASHHLNIFLFFSTDIINPLIWKQI